MRCSQLFDWAGDIEIDLEYGTEERESCVLKYRL